MGHVNVEKSVNGFNDLDLTGHWWEWTVAELNISILIRIIQDAFKPYRTNKENNSQKEKKKTLTNENAIILYTFINSMTFISDRKEILTKSFARSLSSFNEYYGSQYFLGLER